MTASSSRHRALPTPCELEEGVLADLLGYQIVQAELATHRMYMQHIGEPMQLKAIEFTILMLLLANREVTGKRLCDALALSAPNLTILIDRLQERDLIQRVRSETDRRFQYLNLTIAGLALASRAQREAATMEDELKDVLSTAEHAMLVELLSKVARHRP